VIGLVSGLLVSLAGLTPRAPRRNGGTEGGEEVQLGTGRLNLPRLAAGLVLVSLLVVGSASATRSGNDFGETYNPTAATKIKAFGTTAVTSKPVLAALARAEKPLTAAQIKLALKCWKEKACNTGTGGDITVAMADGWGGDVWRQVTHMEFVLQAIGYPEVGKIIYTDANFDSKKAISDLRSLIAQKVDIIIGFPDAGEAVTPTVRQATQRGILYVPYGYGEIGTPGKDYLTYVAEDLCKLGQGFAKILNTQVKSGNVVFLGGTPGSSLSRGWQACEQKALNPGIKVLGTADTFRTRQGSFDAMAELLRQGEIEGISYEYADGFLGAVRAYEAANIDPNVVVTLRTDEANLLCKWKQLNNPNFRIYYGSAGNYDARIALTVAMMKLKGASIPPAIIRPTYQKRATPASCVPALRSASLSTLVPASVLAGMKLPA